MTGLASVATWICRLTRHPCKPRLGDDGSDPMAQRGKGPNHHLSPPRQLLPKDSLTLSACLTDIRPVGGGPGACMYSNVRLKVLAGVPNVTDCHRRLRSHSENTQLRTFCDVRVRCKAGPLAYFGN
jgi:hypothetical protein